MRHTHKHITLYRRSHSYWCNHIYIAILPGDCITTFKKKRFLHIAIASENLAKCGCNGAAFSRGMFFHIGNGQPHRYSGSNVLCVSTVKMATRAGSPKWLVVCMCEEIKIRWCREAKGNSAHTWMVIGWLGGGGFPLLVNLAERYYKQLHWTDREPTSASVCLSSKCFWGKCIEMYIILTSCIREAVLPNVCVNKCTSERVDVCYAWVGGGSPL